MTRGNNRLNPKFKESLKAAKENLKGNPCVQT